MKNLIKTLYKTEKLSEEGKKIIQNIQEKLKSMEEEIDELKYIIDKLENPICVDCKKKFQPQNFRCSICLINHLDRI